MTENDHLVVSWQSGDLSQTWLFQILVPHLYTTTPCWLSNRMLVRRAGLSNPKPCIYEYDLSSKISLSRGDEKIIQGKFYNLDVYFDVEIT